MIKKNPWLGLASYEEPKNDGNDNLFCGRDEETLDVVRLVDNNLFVTLYGSSGIGKTSLLRAGVIPILRRKDYFPLYVRLSQEPKEISYAEAIVRKLQNSGLTEESTAEMKHPDGKDRLYLWNYFAITRFFNEGREVYPVIILDQFEELFREGDRAKAELLLKQVYLLLNDELEMPDEADYSSDTNYRFVASIREDFLFVLEDSIDENSLDLYKNNRYRLRPMKPEQARQVVLVPGKECIEESQKEKVVKRVIELSKKRDSNDIDTLLLSLVCAGTYNKVANDTFALNQDVSIFEEELGIWGSNPMEKYYHDAVKGLTASQIRYIQQHLIRDDGSRRLVDAEEVRTALGETTYRQLTQGTNRLFAVGDKGQVELLHDQLGLAVYEDRKAFEERELKRKNRQKHFRNFGIAFLFLVLGVFIAQNIRIKQTRWKMLENQSRFIAEKSKALAQTDSYLARLLALEALPTNLDHPEKPYTLEAGAALRDACSNNSAIFRGHLDDVFSVAFSPDGKHIISTSYDGTIRVWDFETGQTIHIYILKEDDYISSVAFSPDGKRIILTSDYTVKIWDVETGQDIVILNHFDEINSAVFSPDGKRIVSASDDLIVRIWDVETGQMIDSLTGYYATYSPDGKYIISISDHSGLRIGHGTNRHYYVKSPDGDYLIPASDDFTIRIWDAQTGQMIDSLLGYSAIYSLDGKHIISVTFDNIIRIWDTETKQAIDSMPDSNSRLPVFTPDGKSIAIASADNVIIQDVEDKNVMSRYEIPILQSELNEVNITFSSDGKRFAYMSEKLSIPRPILCVFDVNTGQMLFCDSINFYGDVAFSPDGKYLVAAHNQALNIFELNPNPDSFPVDAESEILIDTLNRFFGYFTDCDSLVFSPNRKRIAYVSSYMSLIIKDIELRQVIVSIERLELYPIAFSHDGEKILTRTRDNVLILWDVETGKMIWKTVPFVNSVAFSPDGKCIVWATYDGIVRIWDMETGVDLKTLKGHSHITSVAFSHDGKYIVSDSDDGTRKIWPFPPLQDLIDQARERFKDRPLTDEERRMYYLE